jgi:hypothetical protein
MSGPERARWRGAAELLDAWGDHPPTPRRVSAQLTMLKSELNDSAMAANPGASTKLGRL